jgi:hypothetical protein
VRRFVDVDGVVPEEGADSVTLPLPNQGFGSLRVDSDGVPVRQFSGAVFVAIHYLVLHGRLKGGPDASHFPGAKVLAQPIGSFQVVLPDRVAGEIFDTDSVFLTRGSEPRDFVVVLRTEATKAPVFLLDRSPNIMKSDAVVCEMGEVDLMYVPREVEDSTDL